MSHSMGVKCAKCQETLENDRCAEGCAEGHGFTYQEPSDWAARTWPNHQCFVDHVAVEDGRREIREFHEAADKTNDVHDHDELHAAGAVLAGDPIWAETDRYVKRWLDGLREMHSIRAAD
jgi:hypothetical protein